MMATEKCIHSTNGVDPGLNYGVKMTAIVALRLYRQADEFYLSTNCWEGEQFNDIVFSAKINGNWTTWFVQLQHKLRACLASRKVSLFSLRSTTRKHKSHYNLITYFDSYKAISSKFKLGSDDPIFGQSYESVRFVLFTNAHLSEDVCKRGYQSIDVPLLSTVGKNIQFDVKLDSDIFINVSEKVLLADFLKRFSLCSHQASEDECDNVLDEEIKKAAAYLTSNEVKCVRGQLYDKIPKWYKNGEYLTKDKIKSLLPTLSAEPQSRKKSSVGVVFEQAFLREEYSLIKKGGQLTFLASKCENTTICTAALEQLHLLDEPNQYLVLSQLDNDNVKDHLVTRFKNQNGIYLIIDVDTAYSLPKLKTTGLFLLELSMSNRKNKIILLAAADNESAEALTTMVSARKRHFNCTLVNLTNEAKLTITERPILFQGYETPLSSILPEDQTVESVFTMNYMSKVLAGQKIPIGIKPIEPIPYYVTRVLSRHMLRSDIFNLCKTGTCFAVSRVAFNMAEKLLSGYTTSIATLTDFLRQNPTNFPEILVLDGPKPRLNFQEALKRNKKMHWLEKSGNNWVWKESGSNVFECEKYFSDCLHYVKTDDVTQIRDKFMLVSAEAGMGKSTLLKHLAAETKVCQPNIWVVSVSLNDFAGMMDSPNFFKNVECKVQAIVAVAAGITNTSSKFDVRLFNYCYRQTGNMIVLLDGFDEITPHYTKQGLEIIRVLKESIIRGVWISSRPIVRDLLQKATNTLSYNIKPLDTSDQKNKKFWHAADLEKENVPLFIDKVSELIRPSGEDADLFAGNPLDTRMIAELFQNDMHNFHINGDTAKIDCLQLLEAFIEKKLRVLDEKIESAIENATSRDVWRMIKRDRDRRLMKLALLALLRPDEYSELQPPILPFEALELKDEVNSGTERTGIVVHFKGDTPQFIHRAFAEYFAARFFETYWKHNVKFTSSNSFFSPSFNFVRHLLNRLLAKDCALHKALLDGDCENLKSLMKSSVNINDIDKAGRTCLHLAASLPGSEVFINELLKAGADPDLKDDTHKLTALEWALKTHDRGNIAPLITSKNLRTVPSNAFPLDMNSFKIAVRGDYLYIFNSFLDRGIIRAVVLPPYKWLDDNTVDGLTYLHLAAAFNASKILEYSLRSNIRDSQLLLLDKKTPQGETALLIAAARGNIEAFEILLKAGSNIFVEIPSGKNVVELAIASQNEHILTSILKILRENRTDADSLVAKALLILLDCKTTWAGPAMAFVISYYPNIYSNLVKEDMPLIAFAISKGNTLALKLLLEFGADVNLVVRSFSLLHMAVSGGFENIVDTLLSQPGIEVDPVDEDGRTPLYVAASLGNLSLFEKLLKRGASLDAVTNDGNDISHAAAESRDLILITGLSEIGVNFNRKNLKGQTAAGLLKATHPNDVDSHLPFVLLPTFLQGEDLECKKVEEESIREESCSLPSPVVEDVFPHKATFTEDGKATITPLLSGLLGKEALLPQSVKKAGRGSKGGKSSKVSTKTTESVQPATSVPSSNMQVVSGHQEDSQFDPTTNLSMENENKSQNKANNLSNIDIDKFAELLKALASQLGGEVAEKANELLASFPV